SLFRRVIERSTETPRGISLNDALEALSSSAKIRSMFAAMTRLTSLVHAPMAADGRALLDQLDGGWGTLIDGLKSACVERGVDLRSGARVMSLEHGPLWRVALADGTALTARGVILAVNPPQAAKLYPLLNSLPGVTDAVPAKVA